MSLSPTAESSGTVVTASHQQVRLQRGFPATLLPNTNQKEAADRAPGFSQPYLETEGRSSSQGCGPQRGQTAGHADLSQGLSLGGDKKRRQAASLPREVTSATEPLGEPSRLDRIMHSR